MRKTAIVLLVAVVVLASLALVACGQLPPSVAFVSPAKTTYYVGETLDLTGAKVTVYEESGDVVTNVTTAMLDASTLPNMSVAGTYTVKGSHNDFEFSFTVVVQPLPNSMAFVSPAKTTYYVGETLDLAGATVTVYAEGGNQVYDVTVDMLDAATIPDMATAGTYTITGSYNDFAFSFDIVVNALPQSVSFVSPAKKVYPLGTNKLDLTGSTITVEGSTVEVTADMLDASTLPNFNQAGRYAVKVVYQGNEFSFGIEVYSPIEIKADTTVKYVRGDDVSKYVQMREVNADGTATDWYGVGQTDVTRCEIVDDKLYVGVDLLVNNVTYGGEYVFDVDNTAISVNQLLQNQASDETYTVNGIVIAIATTMSRDEVIIADKTTGDVIGVCNLAVSGKVSSRTLAIDLEVGDEVILPVKLLVSEADSEAGKLFAQYQGGIFAFLSVVSKNNDKKLDYSNAQVITNQTELKALIGSSAARLANVNKVVKLSGELKFTLYASSRHIRFWFGDAAVKDLTTQKIDGVSPCFCDGTQLYTTGATFSEQILGDANWANTSFTAPDVRHLNIYAMYIGGNGYYHEFVILRTEDVTPIEAQLTNQTFTAPTTTQYMKGSTLDLTGAKIVREYDIKEAETITVTADMLDATSFDMATAGTQTVRGSYDGFDFSFDILIFAKEVSGIEIVAQPTKTTYTHRDGLATLDLTGGKVRVNYSDATYEDFDMDASMLPPTDENWALGTVNYTVTYYGCTTTLAITYENTALTISQVLEKTPDPASTKEEDIAKKTFYEVTGVVVGPATSYAAAELLIKEKTSNKILGIWSAGADVVGSYNALKLNTDIINVGDEITFYASLEIGASDSTSYGMRDKVFLRCQNSDLRNANLKIVSRNNDVNITLTDSDVTVISDATSLKAFLASPTRYYSYVKFVNVQAYQADASNYNLCYGKKAITVTNIPARVSLNNVSNFKSYFSGTPTTSASGAVETTNDFYMLFLGGNSKAHHFTILQSDWVLPRA